MIARAVSLVALLTAFAALVLPASADQEYRTTGDDVYQVGAAPQVTHVYYDGMQRLTVERERKDVRYDAQARYIRDGGGEKSIVNARFVQLLTPSGTYEDELDEDPDFLTVLNQPFAVQLDPQTLHDLRSMRGKVPFNATSPLGGDAELRGFLRPAPPGKVDGRPAAGVFFEAEGPMAGPLPGHSAATVKGRMRMDGTAYYALDDAMLLALRARLTIIAQLRENRQTVPVRIVYERSIRATKMPPPALPPEGGGTVSPATP
jgi:hypothetical protein